MSNEHNTQTCILCSQNSDGWGFLGRQEHMLWLIIHMLEHIAGAMRE